MAENTEVLNLDKPNAGLPDSERKPVLEPLINVEVEDRLLRELKRRLFPNDIEGILYSAITGDLYWQDQLWSLMVDTWPRLQTNLAKLKRAVSSIDYDVNAYVQDGEDKPSPSAVDKAGFVKRALAGMHGNPAKQYADFKETLENIIDSWVSGFTVMEVYWESREGIVPQCTRWIPARYFRYPYLMDDPDRLMLNPSGNLGGTQLFDFPPNKFLVCVKTSHANHPVFSAMMRCLTPWWAASRFGLEWMMTYSQLYGIPQRIAYYEPGDDLVAQQLISMLRNSGAATWGVYPTNTKIEVQGAAGGGGHMPQERLIEQADRVCDILLLGQTLTTDVHESGSRALGRVHQSVWNETKEAAATYVAKVINAQLIPGIIAYNYGEATELPSMRPVIDMPVDLFATAQAMKIIGVDMRVPISLRDVYDLFELSQPEPDEALYEPPAVPLAPNPLHLFTHPGITTPEGMGKNREMGDGQPAGTQPMPSVGGHRHDHVTAQGEDSEGQKRKRDDLINKVLLALLLLYGRSGVEPESTRTKLEAFSPDQLEKLLRKSEKLSKTAVPRQAPSVGLIEAPTLEELPAHEEIAKRGTLPSLAELLKVPAEPLPGPQRTLEESAQAHAVERYFERNSDLIDGVHWHSIMDDRTTQQCRELHDKQWSYPDMQPIGHGVPWPGYPPIFYNCRSSVVPILKPKDGNESPSNSQA
jgi:phage gp29-like protein